MTRAATRRRRRWPLPAGALIAVIALGAMAAVMLGRGGDPAAAPAATNSVTEQTTAPNNDRPSNPDAPAKPAPDPTPTRIVPVLTGLSRSGARARARHHGLAVQITPARSIRIAAGIVARQHPNAGAKVDEGDTIRLTVSTGPPPIEVPDLAGASLTDVQATLASLGLRYTTTAVPSSRDAGSVVSTHPSAGSTVHAGDSIAVSVARAKAWRTVGTYTLTADGSTPSYRITGRKWRLTYTMSSCDVCPFLEIKGGEYEQVDLAEGTHTSYGPGGRGSYRLVANSVGSTGYDLQVIVEQFS